MRSFEGVGRVTLIGLALLTLSRLEAAEPKILHPLPHQVIQRHGFDPRVAPVNDAEGDARGWADVKLVWSSPTELADGWQARVALQEHAYGAAVAWTPLQVARADGTFTSKLRVPAGGWYRLELKHRDGETLAVEPFGVGEVFVVAGQSYAVGANDENLKVEEPSRRVSTFNWREDKWQVADDPIPHAGPKGSLWPALGDILVPLLRTPVGFVNAAVGGTSTRQWATDGKLYADLITAGRKTGDFRAVLWQQGESDVIEKTSRAEYVTRVKVIRESAMKAWSLDVPWLPAKSTLHPTVYRVPAEEELIRAAIGDLWKLPGFRPGPDTDVLDAENRGGPMTMRHFSGIGQRRAAQLWFAALWTELHRLD